jgi:hypothetical protein
MMMILVDYLELLSKGRMSMAIKRRGVLQYVVASFLGVMPGCLGAFMNVSFYLHGLLSFGAIVGGMVATSGEGAFVMLAMMPEKALLLFGILFILGVLSAWAVDRVLPILWTRPLKECKLYEIHPAEECRLLNLKEAILHLRKISLTRFLLLAILGIVVYLVHCGILGGGEAWLGRALIVMLFVIVFIVITVPEHYLEEHIWEHIAKGHIWRVFIWTFLALLFIEMVLGDDELRIFVEEHMILVLLIASLTGMIPESGPNMVFVMMFCEGAIPFSVLLSNMIVQDGHGILPLLSHSVRDAILVKIFNLLIGLGVGMILYLVGL